MRFVLLVLIGLCCCTNLRAADKAVVEKAVAELRREFTAHTKNASSASLRTECDYFKPDAGVSADLVLPILEKPIQGADARQTAYVKWQLLSALPKTVEDESIAQRLVKVYQRAPTPSPRYTCAPREQKELDKLLSGARPEDDVRLTDKLEEAVKRGAEADRPIIAFRDELYRRLSPGRDKYIAALQDANARLVVAADKEFLAEALEKDLPTWAISTADSEKGQVKEVADLLGKLRFVESPTYYKSAGVRRGKLQWISDTDTLLTTKKFATLHKTLLDVSGSAKTSTEKPSTSTRQKKTGTKS
jgi:hypothetical protein